MYDDIIILTANQVFTCVFLCLKMSVLISNTTSIDKCNLHEQQQFDVLNTFEGCKEVLRPKI